MALPPRAPAAGMMALRALAAGNPETALIGGPAPRHSPPDRACSGSCRTEGFFRAPGRTSMRGPAPPRAAAAPPRAARPTVGGFPYPRRGFTRRQVTTIS